MQIGRGPLDTRNQTHYSSCYLRASSSSTSDRESRTTPSDDRPMSKLITSILSVSIMLFALLLSGCADSHPSSQIDRQALISFYNATDGPNWKENSNWLSDAPLNHWYGVTADPEGRVTSLDLWNNQLNGPIPAEIGNLPSLVLLELYGNRLGGEIPAELGNLTNLEWLGLNHNRLSGNIPPALGSLENLQTLDLGSNALGGEIPPELAGLAKLELLNISYNRLTGKIPSGLDRLSSLVFLFLDGNQLSGEIPPQLANLPNLKKLYLGYNLLTGEFPPTLAGLSKLHTLHLTGNQLSGCVPNSMREISGVTFDELGLPFCRKSRDRDVLVMFYHATNGSGWTQRGKWLTSAPVWEWKGVKVDDEGSVTELDLTRNNLSGQIPPELGTLSSLRLLYLGGNRLSGEIPTELGNLTNLGHLALYHNELSGVIPPELGNIPNLSLLTLFGNKLTGCVPDSLRYSTKEYQDQLNLPYCGN